MGFSPAAVQLWHIKLWVFNDWKLQYLFGHVTRMPCRPGAFNRMFNSPGSMELLKCCRWNRIFRSFQRKEEYLRRYSSFFEKFLAEKYVPFDLSQEQLVFPYKRKAPNNHYPSSCRKRQLWVMRFPSRCIARTLVHLRV